MRFVEEQALSIYIFVCVCECKMQILLFTFLAFKSWKPVQFFIVLYNLDRSWVLFCHLLLEICKEKKSAETLF
jgi:hypothetical protein